MLYRKLIVILALAIVVFSSLTGCNAIPRVTAAERTFLEVSLEFLHEYRLPKGNFEDTVVGGLSAITYDRTRDRFYALSDDRSERGPARFYTLKMVLDPPSRQDPRSAKPLPVKIQSVAIEKVTVLKGPDSNPYPSGTIDPEGIVLTPARSLLIASEGVARSGIPPFISEFDLETGAWKRQLPIPKYYNPGLTEDQQPQGVRNNLAFESLTINPKGSVSDPREPFRLFAATESSLEQDPVPGSQGTPSRLLHYLIGDGPPLLISEHVYPLDATPEGMQMNGLTELLSLDQAGHFLSIERAYGDPGFALRVYQVANAGATDIEGMTSLPKGLGGIQPAKKKLLLDISDLKIRMDNLEGMTFGPRLPDGSESLVIVSDDNFSQLQVTQFLLFRLKR
ncbi:MAG: esterase-like activity of phytase family protein [Leptolyngbyaceae cyanobacterium bins.59]|nr:esterase-like activity of phytase family protein [Leptolyngbyaceae cyanobacterium bins.59]